MAKAVASGMPKLKIEESAARRQARIDSGKGEAEREGKRERGRERGRKGGREREKRERGGGEEGKSNLSTHACMKASVIDCTYMCNCVCNIIIIMHTIVQRARACTCTCSWPIMPLVHPSCILQL